MRSTPVLLLSTPSGRGHFTVARYTADGLVLLLGEKEAWTPLPWRAFEQVPDFLRDRRDEKAAISVFETVAQPCAWVPGAGRIARR